MTGAEYRALRTARGWTQQELADMIGRDRMTVVAREASDEIGAEAEYALRWLAHTHTNAQAERYEAEADARWTASHPTMDGRAAGG